jgi:hypothetical protein
VTKAFKHFLISLYELASKKFVVLTFLFFAVSLVYDFSNGNLAGEYLI